MEGRMGDWRVQPALGLGGKQEEDKGAWPART